MAVQASISTMVDVYYQLVKAGRRTINQVPKLERAEVQARIDADNSVTITERLED